MRGILCFLVTVILALPAASAPRGPDAESLRSLTLHPGEVRLSGPGSSQRLVVVATRADGSEVDVTVRARLSVSSPAIAALEGGRLVARGDGQAVVAARLGALAARASVTVRETRTPPRYSFRNDVVPVLARLGCSSGNCHGANSGKGGFRLSLRGYAPEQDFLAITRQLQGRRVSPEAPESSLLLRKPLLQTVHGGGRRLEPGSTEHAVLLGWIRQGAAGPQPDEPRLAGLEVLPGDRRCAPGERQRLLVRARYSDGRVEDVTGRALFRANDPAVAAVTEDGLLSAVSPGATAVQAKYQDQLAAARITVPFPQRVSAAAYARRTHFVDDAVYERLRELNLEPGPAASDAELLRRIYLDALGTLPTVEEARAFLDSPDPRRVETLIDAVLERPEYAAVWALKLADLSLMRKEHMGRKFTVALQQWFTEQFQANRQWDALVADLLTATGSTEEHPQALWWVSRQQTRPGARGWVRHYELTAEIAAQVFLGQRIQCSKCHNHPTERYTQDDYYRFAALFAQVNGDGRADPVPERLINTDAGVVRHPRTGQDMTPMPLDRTDLLLRPGDDRREKLVRWLAGSGQELFSRSIVNRVWARLFGSGIVEPVDDLRSTNPPRNPRLLDALARDLVAHRYDLKYLMRTIMRSRTYQASAEPTPGNRADTGFFSRYPVRRLPAEELLDAVAQAAGVPDRFATYPLGTRAIELSDIELPSVPLDTFGRPPRVMPCDCERSGAPSMAQALELFNGEALQAKLQHPEGRVALLLRAGRPDSEATEELYLAALSRRPTAAERAATARLLRRAPTREEGLQDLLWALLNSKEFMFSH